MGSIAGMEIEIITIVKTVGVAFILLIIYKVISTWAGEMAQRIMYKGIFKRRENDKLNESFNAKDQNGKPWIDRFLANQDRATNALIIFTKEIQELKEIAKQFHCSYHPIGEKHEIKNRMD